MRVDIGRLGSIGLIQDQPPWNLPKEAWSGGQNIRCQDGQIGTFAGHSTFATPTVTPYYLLPVEAGTNYYWIYPGVAKCYVYNGTSHTDITRASGDYTGTSADRWNGAVLNGLPVLNNSIDDPQMWSPVNTGTALAPLTGWDTNNKCKSLRAYKNFLIALNMTESGSDYPHKLRWSNSADPGAVPSSWTPAASNDAGSNVLGETGGHIVDGIQLRDEFIIFKEDGAYGMQYTGGQFVFRFRRINIPGMLAQGCAAEFKGGLFVVGDGDVYITDGQSHESAIDKRNRDSLFSAIDADNYTSTFVTPYHAKNEIWICYPSSGANFPDTAMVWNYKDNTWSHRELPTDTTFMIPGIVTSASFTWDTVPHSSWADWSGSWGARTYSPVADSLVAASDNLYQMDDGNQFGGTDANCYVERTGLDLGAGLHTVTNIYPMTEGEAINVYIGSQMHPNEGVSWSGPYAFDPSTDYKVDCMVTGRYHAVKFQSADDIQWAVNGYGVDYEYAGDA
ncbi:MAG: hypothetical protein GY942_20115 [Aestuariibacter sp.]|nr:hypothetical protein [Aestuariibacter sp.]